MVFAGQKRHINGVHGHGQLNRMNNNNNMESTDAPATADELLSSISVCLYSSTYFLSSIPAYFLSYTSLIIFLEEADAYIIYLKKVLTQW